MATVSRALNYILDLLRALLAVKLGKQDLLTELSAFSATREHMSKGMWIKSARQANFQILKVIELNARQKSILG